VLLTNRSTSSRSRSARCTTPWESKGGAEGALLLESELESEGILYYLSSSSSLFSLERLAKESIGSNSSLDNPKLGKLNRIWSMVKIKG
jgi:hypothetical protein